ncbi:hypothetical protein [Aquisalimonas asiatica]|uniref:Uncharacterized protein n=1 Tax=Aquisalimonas asiatica TaxID=406100 RepID=A0A1H8SRX2_9GAMM|nr:hypothetical protein [Aquisalimonas asiatica]SEO81084.1 hypothetical protein SAMN04488052_103144 [Aquisalimonas asiatica]
MGRHWRTGGWLAVVLLATVGYQLSDWAPLAITAGVALAVYLTGQWPALPRVAKLLFAVAAVAVLALPWFMPRPGEALWLAMDRAIYFATFLACLSFLREAADSSPLVRRCGAVLINQPPAKRYATLSFGAYLIGVVLNMGVLNLLGVMIRKANTLDAAGGHAVIQQVRQQRMFTAMLRGFAVSPLGSPLTITLAVILSVMPDLRWQDVLPYGLLTMVLLMALGWVVDRATAPRQLASMANRDHVPGALATIARFLALVLAIFAGAVAIEELLEVELPVAIMIAAPVAAIVWMWVQWLRAGWGRSVMLTASRVGRRSPEQFAGLRAELTVLCAAGVMGTMIAAAVPETLLAETLQALGLYGPPVAVAVTLLMLLFAQVGLNPIVTATIALTSLSQPAVFGLAPELLALSVMTGWALAVGMAPLTTSVLITARVADVPATTVGYRWNGWFTVGSAVLVSGWLLVLGWVIG